MEPKSSPRDLYILGTLSRRRTYGHEINKAIRLSRADRWLSISEKHVYYVLRKLSRDGLVNVTEERAGNNPPRKVYEITETGRQALREMLLAADLRQSFIPSPFDAVIGMLAYTDVLTPAETVHVLRDRRAVLQRRLHDEHPEGFGEIAESMYGYLARSLYEKSRALLMSEIAWMDEVLERVTTSDWASLRVPADFLDAEDI